MQNEGRTEPANLEEQALLLVGRDIYEKLIKGYTEKQWGRPCTQLPAFIIKRLPVRLVFYNNYFNDLYQGIPIGGYNRLIERLLEGSDVMLNTDFLTNRESLTRQADKILYTGAIDAFYDFCYGKLEYRTVRFEQSTLDIPNYQGNAVINYTDAQTPYTRIIEHKHFEMFGPDVDKCPHTVISKEYSTEWTEGMEPYYPINDQRNTNLYQQYQQLARQETKVLFGGRLAEYKYYDMAPTIKNSLILADSQIH
jgi:UDP-galactopyranose mutase